MSEVTSTSNTAPTTTEDTTVIPYYLGGALRYPGFYQLDDRAGVYHHPDDYTRDYVTEVYTRKNYDLINAGFHGDAATSLNTLLERAFAGLQNDRPGNLVPRGRRSSTIGDVFEVHTRGQPLRRFVVVAFGFEEVFEGQPYPTRND